MLAASSSAAQAGKQVQSERPDVEEGLSAVAPDPDGFGQALTLHQVKGQ